MPDEIIPDLRRTLRGLAKDEILVPAMYAELNDPSFEGFQIQVEPWSSRPPDGYFHPSTQSTWNVRQLALYLMAPNLFENERMAVTSILAITQGHFWHMFIQRILKDTKLLDQDEVGFTDEEHKRRGHMDGLIKVRGQAEGLEIKTINPFKIQKITSEADLKRLKPEYWSQAQEYLDVFDLPRMRFLFISPSYPFPMKEFVVPADPSHQKRRREIYKGAIEIAGAATLPLPAGGCCQQYDTCSVRRACQWSQ